MNKNLKETLKLEKKLHKKGLIYLNDNIELTSEPNYQVLAIFIEKLDILMHKDIYEDIKDDRIRLINEMAISTFNEEDLISDRDIEFKENLIEEFIDIDDPVLICDEYCFVTKIDKLQEVYNKALKQIDEGKFENMIF